MEKGRENAQNRLFSLPFFDWRAQLYNFPVFSINHVFI
jgi:hypothetical protein